MAYSIKTKDESAQSLESYLVSARNILGKDEKICYIRSDQGTEFTGRKFLEVMKREKIESELAPPYTPEHNEVSERFNRTLQEKIRAYMFDSGLPKTMWQHALDAAVHAYNRTPHKTIEFEIPIKKFAPHSKSHFDQIKRSGSIAYVKVTKPDTKFDSHAIRAVLVGYDRTSYLLWYPTSRKFLQSRHVRFNEKIVYRDIYKNDESEEKSTAIPKEHTEENDENWLRDTREVKDKVKSADKEKDNVEPKKRGRP